MAASGGGGSGIPRTGYLTKVALIYAFTLADLLANSTADHNDVKNGGLWWPMVLLGCVVALLQSPARAHLCLRVRVSVSRVAAATVANVRAVARL
jgi:hypothetical protein